MTERRPTFIRCGTCNAKVKVPQTGRIKKYCSDSCRQRAFYAATVSPFNADNRQRQLVWTVLQDAGLVSADKPLPPKRTSGSLKRTSGSFSGADGRISTARKGK